MQCAHELDRDLWTGEIEHFCEEEVNVPSCEVSLKKASSSACEVVSALSSLRDENVGACVVAEA